MCFYPHVWIHILSDLYACTWGLTFMITCMWCYIYIYIVDACMHKLYIILGDACGHSRPLLPRPRCQCQMSCVYRICTDSAAHHYFCALWNASAPLHFLHQGTRALYNEASCGHFGLYFICHAAYVALRMSEVWSALLCRRIPRRTWSIVGKATPPNLPSLRQ